MEQGDRFRESLPAKINRKRDGVTHHGNATEVTDTEEQGPGMPISQPPTTPPPRPPAAPTQAEYAEALRRLRKWADLTLTALEDADPTLSDSTISEYERGTRRPKLERVHAYVQACLRHRWPEANDARLSAEFTHWRDALTNVGTEPPPPPVELRHAEPVPVPEPTAVTAPAEPTTPDTTATATAASPRRRLPSRRVMIVSGCAALGAVVVVVGGAVALNRDTIAAPLNDTMDPIHASGIVDNLGVKDGVDLDTGQRRDQESPGVDISFSSTSTHLDAMHPRVAYQPILGPVSTERRYCDLPYGWTRTFDRVHELTEGQNICVRTDEGRLAMLTITQPATPATGTIGFRYTTWG